MKDGSSGYWAPAQTQQRRPNNTNRNPYCKVTKLKLRFFACSGLDQSRFEQPGLGTPTLGMAESIYYHFLISIFGCQLLEKRKSYTKLVIN